MTAAVSVRRNPTPRDTRPWLVYCATCSGDALFFAFLPRLLGWAPDWRTAYDYAHTHALAHEARRCTTCLHLPAGPLPNQAATR